MELKNIAEIQDGMVVFMPSGIQATLHKVDEDILVEYPEMYQDRYNKEQFEKLIEEGIFIFNEPSQLIMESFSVYVTDEEDELVTHRTFDSKEEAEEAYEEEKGYLEDGYSVQLCVGDTIDGDLIKTSLDEGYDQKDCPQGSVYKQVQELPDEYLSADFKNDLLTALTKIAKEYPNTEVRQQALTFIDEINLQVYYDTKAVKKFIKDNEIPKLEESLNSKDERDLKQYLQDLCQREGIELKDLVDWPLDDLAEIATDNLSFPITKQDLLEIINYEIDYYNTHYSESLKEEKSHEQFGLLDFIVDVSKIDEKSVGQNPIDVYNKVGVKVASGFYNKENDRTVLTVRDNLAGNLYKDGLFACKELVKDPEFKQEVNRIVNCLEDLSEEAFVDVYKNGEHQETYVCNDVEEAKAQAEEEIRKDPQAHIEIIDNNQGAREELVKEIDSIEDLNEEEGPFAGSYGLKKIANEIQAGKKSGYEPTEFGNWKLETSVDEKWESLTANMADYLLEKIAMPIRDGHTEYTDLELVLHSGSGLNMADLETLDMFDNEQIHEILGDGEGEAYISFELKFDGENTSNVEESFKVKKKKKKKLDELSKNEDIYLKDEDGNEEGPFVDKEAEEEFIDTQRKNGNKKEYEEVIKESMENLDLKIKDFYINEYPDDTLGNEINPDATFAELNQNLPAVYDIIGVGDSIVRERVFEKLAELVGIDYSDVYNAWLGVDQDLNEDLNRDENIFQSLLELADEDGCNIVDYEDDDPEVLAQRINDKFDINVTAEEVSQVIEDEIADMQALYTDMGDFDESLNEDCYKVYNAINPGEEAACLNSWQEVEDYLNAAWGEYQADMAKAGKEFGTKDDFMSTYDIAIEPIEPACIDCNPAEEPMDMEAEQDIEDQAEIVMEELEEPTGIPDKDKQKQKEEKDGVFNGEDTKIDEMCMTKLPDPKQVKKQNKEADALEQEFRTVRKNALANPNLYGGRYTQKSIKQARAEFMADREKNEDFTDNMGMLTDINDLDFPDAMQTAVPTTAEGEVLTPDKYAQEIEDLKAMVKSLKTELMAEIKTELTSLIQDLKSDIKTDVNDVENKVDDTKDAVDDLAVEDEEMSDIEFDEEPTEESIEEPEEENEEPEQQEECFSEKDLAGDPIYEGLKKVVKSLDNKVVSIPTIAQKMREDIGINTKIESNYLVVKNYMERTSLKEGLTIVDIEEEKRILKESALGAAAKWLSGGLMSRLADQKKNILEDNITQIKQEIEKMAKEGKDAQEIKDKITMEADNEQEEEQAKDFALDKLSQNEAYKVSSIQEKLLRTASTAKLNNLF